MYYDLKINDQNLYLLPEKAIYWKQTSTLIVADLHLGKAGYFNQNGIRVPTQLNKDILNNIDDLLDVYETKRIIFLGDLFHSRVNQDWNYFWDWKEANKHIEIILTVGNHDRYGNQEFLKKDLRIKSYFKEGPFQFQHDENEFISDGNSIILAGHVHPCFYLRGKGRQKIRVKCFVKKGDSIILPAFGLFTGSHQINQTEYDAIYGIIEDEVVKF